MLKCYHKCGVIAGNGAFGQLQVHALLYQHLAGEGQTYARTMALGGKEGNEYFSCHIGRYGSAVVADLQGIAIAHVYLVGTCFDGILHYVYEHLS